MSETLAVEVATLKTTVKTVVEDVSEIKDSVKNLEKNYIDLRMDFKENTLSIKYLADSINSKINTQDKELIEYKNNLKEQKSDFIKELEKQETKVESKVKNNIEKHIENFHVVKRFGNPDFINALKMIVAGAIAYLIQHYFKFGVK